MLFWGSIAVIRENCNPQLRKILEFALCNFCTCVNARTLNPGGTAYPKVVDLQEQFPTNVGQLESYQPQDRAINPNPLKVCACHFVSGSRESRPLQPCWLCPTVAHWPLRNPSLPSSQWSVFDQYVLVMTHRGRCTLHVHALAPVLGVLSSQHAPKNMAWYVQTDRTRLKNVFCL